ncbi:MAG: response regulator [archaeon]
MAKVLIADDTDRDVSHLTSLLKQNGHEVIRALCSVDAQREIVAGQADCAVYDGSLPRYTDMQDISSEWGAAFLARESRRRRPEMPCIVYTHGISNQEHIQTLRDLNVPIFIKEYEDFSVMFKRLGLPEIRK